MLNDLRRAHLGGAAWTTDASSEFSTTSQAVDERVSRCSVVAASGVAFVGPEVGSPAAASRADYLAEGVEFELSGDFSKRSVSHAKASEVIRRLAPLPRYLYCGTLLVARLDTGIQ